MMYKTKKPLAILLCVVMLVSLLTGLPLTASAADTYWDSYASAAQPITDYTETSGNYAVKTALGLAYIASIVNGGNDLAGKTVTLENDIDLDAHYWVPIGQLDSEAENIANQTGAFRGTFDGAGHYVKNMKIGGSDYNTSSGAYGEANALFGVNIGIVKNTGVVGVSVDTYRRGAGIAGINLGTIEACMSAGEIKANGGGGSRGTGGIAGSNYGIVKDCYSAAHVYNAYRRAGGIVGYNTTDYGGTGTVTNCFFTGYAESASDEYSGSIAASNDKNAAITSSYYLENSAKDIQDNGCPIVKDTAQAGAQAYEFDAEGKLSGGGSLLTAQNTSGTVFAQLDGAGQVLPVFGWENMYNHTDIIPEPEPESAAITVKSADGYFADVPLTLEQLKAFETTENNYSRGSTVYHSITGIKLPDLLSYVPYGAFATEVIFRDTPESGSNPFIRGVQDYSKSMLIWSRIETEGGSNGITGFSSAYDTGSGKYWWSNITTVEVKLPFTTVTVATAPSNAAVTITDSKGTVIAPSGGTYKLVQGETYSYGATAAGYIGAAGTFTADAVPKTVTVTLTQSGGGSGGNDETSYTITGYSGTYGTVTPNKNTAKAGESVTLTVAPASGYGLTALSVTGAAITPAVSSSVNSYTFTMPSGNTAVTASFDKIVLTLNAQNGTAAPVKAAVFTKTELEALAQTNTAGWAYLYSKDDVWHAIVATKLVSLTNLFNAAGIGAYWKPGSYLAFTCSDGVYDKSYPDYNDISKCRYYMDGSIQQDVPAGIALEWDSGSTADYTISQLAQRAYDSGSLRFVYGLSQETYTNKSAAGARSPSGVLEVTLVYDASSIPTGSVGTTHGSEDTSGNDSDSDTQTPTEKVEATVTEQKAADGSVMVSSKVTADAMDTALKSLPKDTALEVNAKSSGGNAAAVEVTLPVTGVKAAGDQEASVVLTTDFGSITFDKDALGEMAKTAESGDITVTASTGKGAAPGMTDSQKTSAGDNTIVRLEAKNNAGKSVASFGKGSVVVSITYKAASADKTVKVSRINEDGSLTDMKASYSGGIVKWSTSSFSYYMIEEVEAAKAMPFTDVKTSDWFYDAVAFAYERKLFSGVSGTEFAPNAAMTRAMLVTVLYRVENSPQISGGSPFTDVYDTAEYFYNPVVWASENGIVGGYSGEYFGAGDNITREQLVTILYRYAQYKKYNVTQADNLKDFTDKDTVSNWSESAMQWAVAAGIISGSDGMLTPLDFASRAQVAAILQRFIEKYE